MRSSREDVERILSLVRKAIDDNNYYFIDRVKTMRTLAALGIRPADAIDEFKKLKYRNYIKGPDEDRNRPGTDKLWFFKKVCFGELIYIKFKIEFQINNGLKIISFHFDEQL